MGCRKQTKEAFKVIVRTVKPAVAAAARDIVTTLENEAFNMIAGTTKKDIAVAHVKEVAKREGRELRTCIAETVVTGVLSMAREGVGRLEEIGEDDPEDE